MCCYMLVYLVLNLKLSNIKLRQVKVSTATKKLSNVTFLPGSLVLKNNSYKKSEETSCN